MTHIVIYHDALSYLNMANLREFNREHHSVTVTVVNADGYCNRYKIAEAIIDFIIGDIPKENIIRR